MRLVQGTRQYLVLRKQQISDMVTEKKKQDKDMLTWSSGNDHTGVKNTRHDILLNVGTKTLLGILCTYMKMLLMLTHILARLKHREKDTKQRLCIALQSTF